MSPKCFWGFCVIHFKRGTGVASCLNLLTFFCLQCSCRRSQPFNGTHRCRFSRVRKQRPRPPDLRDGRDNTFFLGGGRFIHVSAGISAFAKPKQRPFCPQSSERRWVVKSQMGSSFYSCLFFFFVFHLKTFFCFHCLETKVALLVKRHKIRCRQSYPDSFFLTVAISSVSVGFQHVFWIFYTLATQLWMNELWCACAEPLSSL